MRTDDLKQAWPAPSRPCPVLFIGAGGIVQNAHIPAYRRLGIPFHGFFDLDEKASARARELAGSGQVLSTLAEAVCQPGVVFDVALPASAVYSVLEALPDRASVLIQKPLGETLEEARKIVALCRRKQLLAAVNLQLRFSPGLLALRDAVERELVGRVIDVEVRVNAYTPWQLWPFLRGIPRHELLYHSIHYLDFIRSLLGEPLGVYSRAVRHPSLSEYSDTRSATIVDYGDQCRVCLSVFHGHDYGPRHAMSQIKVEGSQGAIVAKLGVNLNYPEGEPDTLELNLDRRVWQSVALRGSWFPEAFEGTMSNLQRYAAGEDDVLWTSVDDAARTMALVEACYLSSACGGTPIPSV
ncbi:MAG TPA: Gfo/Idh/MocA family oxidoreductase [Polyangiaceae bacterium]|nr:Gfo/Idh/MocA family oxidoreductase [Polyangiaceae bacterium]